MSCSLAGTDACRACTNNPFCKESLEGERMATVKIRSFAEAVVELASEKPELYISMCGHPSLYGVWLRVKHKNHFIDRVISYSDDSSYQTQSPLC